MIEKIFPGIVDDDRKGANLDAMYVASVILAFLAVVFAVLGATVWVNLFVAAGVLGGAAVLYYVTTRLLVHRLSR